MILAVDLGSTSFKVAVFDDAGIMTGTGSSPLAYRFGQGGQAEIGVNVAVDAFTNAVSDALAGSGLKPNELTAVAVTSQAQTWTILDTSGRAKMDFRTWQDTRADTSRDTLAERLPDFKEHCSFGSLLGALQVSQLYHLQETAPGLLTSDDRIVNLPTFLVYLMTGQAVTDNNISAMSGLYSLIAADWWDDALRACRIERRQLPRLIAAGSPAGSTSEQARAFGLPPGLPVVLCGNDQTANGFGARLEEGQSTALLTLGTAQVAYAFRRESLPSPAPGLIRGPYPGGGFYSMGADSVGGSVINWAKTVVAGGNSDHTFFELASCAEAGAEGLRFEADLDCGRGAWTNMGFHHGPAHLARSVVDALALRLAALVDVLEIDAARTRFLVTGGGSAARPWVEATAAALATQLTRIDSNPLIGAARMAALAISKAR